MLAFVPVAFDLYRPLKPRLRWAMQCLVSFADGTGRCFPSIRKFARHAGISKSAAGRDLAELAGAGTSPASAVLVASTSTGSTRNSCRNGRNVRCPRLRTGQMVVASSTVASMAGSVPTQGTKENPDKKNQGWTRKRARFTKPGLSYGELSDETAKWRLRLRSWHQSRFWLPLWGPRADRARLHGTSNAAANRNMTDKLLSLDDLGARSAPLGRSCLFGLRPCCLPSRTAYRWLGVIHRTSTEPI